MELEIGAIQQSIIVVVNSLCPTEYSTIEELCQQITESHWKVVRNSAFDGLQIGLQISHCCHS